MAANPYIQIIWVVCAIIPVHQMGMPCNLKPILALAAKFKLPVIEDAACAIGSKIKIGSSGKILASLMAILPVLVFILVNCSLQVRVE